MKKFIVWWEDRLKTDYTPRGLFVRVAVDIVLSNLGLLLGILTTVGIWAFTWTETSQEFFHQMFLHAWLANVPMLTACCLFAYSMNGLYRGTRDVPYSGRIFGVIKAVGTAFLLFLFGIYLTNTFMPRSTMGAGWFFIFALILLSRLLSTAFFRQYHITPSATYDPQIEKIVRELSLLSQQDGWIPPEGLFAKSAWPYFEDNEVLAAVAVLRSGKINQWTGKEVNHFQEEFAAFCGVRHAIALASGSIALDLALYALNIGNGDEVIVTPRTFIASASCVALRGAKPVFADVHPKSQNITAESIVKAITPRTRAIIAVHLAGWPCDMDSILGIAEKYHLKVIEDCAQSHGAIYYSRRPGRVSAIDQGVPLEKEGVRLYPRLTGSMGDMAAFSFCQDKIMTTGGEGGMLLTNDEALWEKAWAFKDHGKSYDAVYHRQHPAGFRWLHESFGTNGRLTEMQAAIGRQQLRKLPEWVAIRQRNAMILTEAFSNIQGLRITCPPENIRHSYYKYYVFVRPERLKEGWDRDRIMNAVTAAGAPCFSGSCSEVYLEKAFDGNGLRPAERLQVAKELGETSLMFLVHPTLTEKNMMSVASIVGTVMSEAEK
jgi:dTDP-4-amino-4,6-dideoxygalactose transaminase